MSRLDDELAQALRASELESATERRAEEPVVAPVFAPKRTSSRKGNLGLLVGLLVLGGSILTLVMTSFDQGAIYSKDVDVLFAEKERLGDRTVRVTGTLVKGSLEKRDAPCEFRFRIEKNGKVLPVEYPQCIVPDTFRDVPGVDVEVTATGKLVEGERFLAQNIMAKCPSRYEMKQAEAYGETMPHGPVNGS